MSHVITCPSGLSGTIRGLKVREERFLTDRKLLKSGGVVDELLRACWQETLDPGPYSFASDKPDWARALRGDRFYTLLEIRALTYGPEYSFSVACRERGCRARIDWEIDLRDLPVRPLSDESRQRFQDGNRFEVMLPGADRRVWFRLPLGADEVREAARRKDASEHVISSVLGARCLEVEGLEPKQRRQFIEDLSLQDATFLMGEFERVDCGVETGIEIECPECYALQEVELPFDRSFFLPSKKTSSRDRRGSSQG